MLRPVVLIAAAGLALATCSVRVTPVDVGGSKADGTVKMSFEYGSLQTPIVDWKSALIVARGRCRRWGYRKTDPFGGVLRRCLVRDGYGSCARWQATRTYQCAN